MSTQSIGTSGANGAPVNFSGLGSGLNTSSIISALMAVERAPVNRLTHEQEVLQAEQQQLQGFQSSLQQLAFSAAEFTLPSLYETSQTVTSSEPSKVSATTSAGAAVGGHQVNVTQLANSAQRTFAFTSPTSEDTLTIDGQQIKVAAGSTIKELINTINSDSKATVYAAALDSGTVVLSDRSTGNNGEGYIAVSDPGGTLAEKAGLAKQGQNAEYSVDGVAATSTSNTVTNAIAGVTLNLGALTTVSGPVTINVAAPGPNASGIETQVKAFVTLYNSTIAAIHKQISAKPPTNPQSAAEDAARKLFGDPDLGGLLNSMRQSIYTPAAGLPTEMASLEDIGVSTGAATGASPSSQSSIEGQLTVNSATLTAAIQANPAGVQQMLQSWSQGFQSLVNAAAAPGGTLDARITGDSTQITNFSSQITTMNEMLAVRQEALQAQFTQLEGAMSQNQSQATWLASQTASLTASGL